MDELAETGLVLTNEDSAMTINYLEGKMTFSDYSAYMESRSSTFTAAGREPSNALTAQTSEVTTDNNDSSVAFDMDESSSDMPGKGAEGRVPRSRLPKDLHGLVGEANLKFARGEYQEAISMCNEVIRLAPNAPEPYQTLSLLYEECGDMEKSLQCGLLGVYLNPKCVDEWMRLSEMALEMGNIKQAVVCYRQVIKYDRSNTAVMWECATLEAQLGDHRRAAETIRKMLDTERAQTDGVFYFQVARELAKNYHGTELTALGIACLEAALDKHPTSVTSEDVNLLAELYIAAKMHRQVVALLTRHCGVEFELEESGEGGSSSDSPSKRQRGVCSVPAELPIDLRTKLIVCFINMQLPVLAQSLLGPLMEESPDDMGDLYLDVAEAFLDNGDYLLAKPILWALVRSSQYNLAAVWLRYAECLNALSELPLAIGAYRKVVELAPSHLDARLALSLLLQQDGQHDDALLALSSTSVSSGVNEHGEPQLSKYSGQDPRLLLHCCHLLYTQARFDEFIDAVQYLLFGQIPKGFIARIARILVTLRTTKHRFSVLKEKFGADHEAFREAPAQTGGSPLSLDEMWGLFLKACYKLDSQQDYAKLLEFVLLGMATAKFAFDADKQKELDFMCLVIQILQRKGKNMLDIIRDIVVKDFDNNQVQNLFAQSVIVTKQDIRHSRFCERLLQKHEDSARLRIANGHNSLLFGSYKTALNDYVAAYRTMSDSPLLNLLIGVCFCHIASQQFAANRATLVVQACGFLQKYAELRGHCQEAYYNLARAMQQLSLNHAAVYYYERALETPAPDMTATGKQQLFDLSSEAAYNLALIYRTSGSDVLAQQLYQRYCVI